MSLDHLFDEKEGNIPTDKLSELSNLCSLYKDTQQDIEKVEEKLKKKKEELENISRNLIPSILNEVGLSEVRLVTGEKVIVEDKLKASIADKNYMLAYQNMIKAEGGDEQAEKKIDSLFKSKAVIENISDEILELLIEHEIPYDMKRDIHYQTLNKYCRERLDHGDVIPEGISVFQYQETKLK